ncbi:MAG: amidohydrolase [Fimbriimonadaceae bacterium]|nr:amidohydrolase [Fimbriimonadaceae bacterium]
MSESKLSPAVAAVLPEAIAIRRDLHQHPEVAFEELRTAAVVAAKLRELGLKPRTGIAKTGVTALLKGGAGDGPTVLLRADMDALPVTEENDVPYRSTIPGRMHACGHDGHTAILLGAARVLQLRMPELPGRVKLVFQPAEETIGGAEPMIAEGVLDDPPVDYAFGLHLWAPQPTGTVGVCAGPFMAGTDMIRIRVTGSGGHAAMPAQCVDPILAAAQLVTGIQSIVSRNLPPREPAVVSITQFHAGDTFNVIPPYAELVGTARYYSDAVRDTIRGRLEQLVRDIPAAFGATGELTVIPGYPVTVNDRAMTELVRAAAAEAVGPEQVVPVEPVMGGEDFAYFLQRVPGCYFTVGIQNEAKGTGRPHHHPRFDLDEDALGIGIETLVRVAERALQQTG